MKDKFYGMAYIREKMLVKDFENSFISSLSSTTGLILLRETKTNWGIVDLLAIKYDTEKLDQRKKIFSNKNIPEFTNLTSYAITHIINNPYISVNELSEYLKIKNGSLKDTIQNLIDRGLIHYYNNGKLRAKLISNIYVIKEILAFEVKLNNWKKAIVQAERHLWFTNSSFIVLPTLTNNVKSKVYQTCIEKGIGLIIQYNENNFHILKQPLYKKHIDSIISWKINEALVDGSNFNGSSPLR